MNAPTSAVKAVFGTAELIEAVLLQADLMAILRCRQVNKTFRHSIQRSSAINDTLLKLVAERSIPLDTSGSCVIVCTCRRTSDGDDLRVTCELTLSEEERYMPWDVSRHPSHRNMPANANTQLWLRKQYLRGSWEDLRLAPADRRSIKVKLERAWVLEPSCLKTSHHAWEEDVDADVTLGQVVAAVMKRQGPVEPGIPGIRRLY